jgi:hypothetical protein
LKKSSAPSTRAPNTDGANRPPLGQLVPGALAALWAFVTVDFLSHAVVLAEWWRATERYWLPPADLVRLIPLGYASFAIYCSTLTWLFIRLRGARSSLWSGLRFGAVAGLIAGTGSVLAIYSALRMPASALLVWPASIAAASAGAGAAAAWVAGAERPWRRTGLVIAAGLLFFVAGVIVQNTLLPTPADRLVSMPGASR